MKDCNKYWQDKVAIITGATHEWISNSDRYEFSWGTIDGVCGWLEEHLNYWDWYMSWFRR